MYEITPCARVMPFGKPQTSPHIRRSTFQGGVFSAGKTTFFRQSGSFMLVFIGVSACFNRNQSNPFAKEY